MESGHEQLQQQTRRNSSSDTTTTTHIAQSWKFFDPLASPTGEDHEELLRLEAMLDAKARKANQGLILETRPDIIASHSELKSKKEIHFCPKNIFSLCISKITKKRSIFCTMKIELRKQQ